MSPLLLALALAAQAPSFPPLAEPELVAQVLARNPSLEAARAAVRAAQERVPRERALDDPHLTLTGAPLSFFDGSPAGFSVELDQTFPLGGKRDLAGEQAAWEAKAQGADLDTVRLSLALDTVRLFDAWFTVHRALAINADHQTLVGQLKQSALAEYAAGRASEQDPLEAEVELTHLEHQAMVLEADRDVIRAELNGLLHRAPDAPLSPPPDALAIGAPPPAAATLLNEAARQRPELAGLRDRLAGADTGVRLARSAWWPDLGVMTEYDSMWPMPDNRWMVGLTVNLPIEVAPRDAAIGEAEAMRAQLSAEQAAQLDAVRVDVTRAARRLEEAIHIAHLYRTRLVPAAEDEVRAARAGFVAGRNPFNALIEAEKNLRTVEMDAEEAEAGADTQRAVLDRALGQIPGLASVLKGQQP